MDHFQSYALSCGLAGLLVSLAFGLVVLRARGTGSVLGRGRGPEFHHKLAGGGAIPRLGGLCIVGGFLASALVAGMLYDFGPMASKRFWALMGCALAMFAVGMFDDFRPLGAKRKLLLQVLVAIGAYWLGFQIGNIKNPFSGHIFSLGGWGFVVTVFWLVAMTNLINLIDGIDGLAAGIGIMLMGLLVWVSYSVERGFYSLLCVGVIGALLGFLRFNFPPAKMYMGDGGAYFLGCFLGLLSIETSHKGTVMAALTAPALALALPILDTTLALLRRGIKGLPLFRPDLDHIHHKLVQRGVTRTRAVLTLYAFSVVALCFAVSLFIASGQYVSLFVGTASLALILLLRYLKVIPNFWSIGVVVQDQWKLRWLSRYLLALGNWLELEAERSLSLTDLSHVYAFFSKRMGFSQVTVSLGGIERTLLANSVPGPLWHRCHRFSIGQEMAIEFSCPEGQWTRREFDHVTDLAAEAWLKAATRWQQAHHKKATLEVGTTGPQDYETTGPPLARLKAEGEGQRTAGLRDHRTTDNGTTDLKPEMTTGQRDDKTTRLQDHGTTDPGPKTPPLKAQIPRSGKEIGD